MPEKQERPQGCGICNRPLTDAVAWKLPAKLGRKYVPMCIKCQEKYFSYLASALGYKLAMFVCCAAFNMPYIPELLEESKEYVGRNTTSWGKVGTWGSYFVALKQNGYDKATEKGGMRGFRDGVTDIKKAFDGETPTLVVDDKMLSDEDYQEGIKVQAEMWGTGPDEDPYTESDYRELNRYYDALTTDRSTVGAQTELAIQNVCQWMLQREKLLNSGDINNAQRLSNMIKTEMESEALRGKDERQEDITRIDDIRLALDRAGMPLMSYEETAKALAQHAFKRETDSYDYTWDAADKMLLYIARATAWNEGREEPNQLPDDMTFENDEWNEFAPVQDATEKQIYHELQESPSARFKADEKKALLKKLDEKKKAKAGGKP